MMAVPEVLVPTLRVVSQFVTYSTDKLDNILVKVVNQVRSDVWRLEHGQSLSDVAVMVHHACMHLPAPQP